jgi:hypothetical protein
VDCLHPADLPIRQPNLDAVRVACRFCQDVFDNAPGQLAGALIRFQHDFNIHAGLYVRTVSSIHQIDSLFVGVYNFLPQKSLSHIADGAIII